MPRRLPGSEQVASSLPIPCHASRLWLRPPLGGRSGSQEMRSKSPSMLCLSCRQRPVCALLVTMPNTILQIDARSEEHTSELQSRENLVCRLLLEKKNFIYLFC